MVSKYKRTSNAKRMSNDSKFVLYLTNKKIQTEQLVAHRRAQYSDVIEGAYF